MRKTSTAIASSIQAELQPLVAKIATLYKLNNNKNVLYWRIVNAIYLELKENNPKRPINHRIKQTQLRANKNRRK